MAGRGGPDEIGDDRRRRAGPEPLERRRAAAAAAGPSDSPQIGFALENGWMTKQRTALLPPAGPPKTSSVLPPPLSSPAATIPRVCHAVACGALSPSAPPPGTMRDEPARHGDVADGTGVELARRRSARERRSPLPQASRSTGAANVPLPWLRRSCSLLRLNAVATMSGPLAPPRSAIATSYSCALRRGVEVGAVEAEVRPAAAGASASRSAARTITRAIAERPPAAASP